jgi:hypothetical protein
MLIRHKVSWLLYAATMRHFNDLPTRYYSATVPSKNYVDDCLMPQFGHDLIDVEMESVRVSIALRSVAPGKSSSEIDHSHCCFSTPRNQEKAI